MTSAKLERNKFGYHYKGVTITRKKRNRWSVYSGANQLDTICFSLQDAVALIDSKVA